MEKILTQEEILQNIRELIAHYNTSNEKAVVLRQILVNLNKLIYPPTEVVEEIARIVNSFAPSNVDDQH